MIFFLIWQKFSKYKIERNFNNQGDKIIVLGCYNKNSKKNFKSLKTLWRLKSNLFSLQTITRGGQSRHSWKRILST